MADRDDVCVLVPVYDEAATVGDVVEGFREQGFEHVLVVDGGSTDDTREVARDAGARVVTQSGEGKGQAVREAVHTHVDRPFVLMVDGDMTYRPDEADRMLEPLFEDRADHVVGNRFADMRPGAMTRLNRAGNRLINRTFSVVHGRHLVDILSGYRAFTAESFRRLGLDADGFGIETEMAVECVKHDVRTAVVPITYEPRPADSDTNLRPFRDGARILLTLYQMAKTNNPLFYFGSVGGLSTLVGVLLAWYVAYEWFVVGISHEVIALASAASVIFGIQLLIFGVLSDMIVALNREQTRRIERLAAELGDDRSGVDRHGTAGAPGTEEPTAPVEDPVDDDATARSADDASEERAFD